jgi:hypothetical protein
MQLLTDVRVNKLPAPASASKKPAAVSLSDDSDSEDLIIDVKGKGKEIFYRTPTKRKISNPRASSASALRLTDSDDDVKPTRTPSRPPETPTPHKTRPPPRGPGSDRRHASPVLLDLDDDEKPDVKLQLADLDADSSDSDFIELTGPPDPKEENNDDELAYWIQQAKTLEEETQNVIVTVIVTSRIAGTKPVMIRRRLNQVIRPVLETWIDRQRSHDIDVPEDVERGMFLTWKGHKVYSSSTLASLGIPVDPATGTVKPSRDGGFRQDMLHIEVWTEEAWAGHLRETEQQRKLQIGIYDDDSGGDGAANPAAKDELAVAEEKYNVRLKSQDQMIPCTISPSYRVKEIIEMFREVAKLGEDRDISIWFDGEQLDEDALAVEAAELEPDEISQLEVRVK